MTADLTEAQLSLLADHRVFGHVPPGADREQVRELQRLDLVDDYGRVTPLGAMLLARWEDAADEPFAHVGFDADAFHAAEARSTMRGIGIGLLLMAAMVLIVIGIVALVIAS